MPLSAVRRFGDADDYATAIRGGVVEMTVTERGSFSAKLTRIDLHRLWLQRFSENLPRVADIAGLASGRAYFTFRTRSGPELRQSGLEIVPSAVLRFSQADEYYHRSYGAADFATISLPLAAVAAVGETMAGADLSPPSDAISATPPPPAMARLQGLHAAAGRLAEDAPEIIADPEAARGLEQALMGALAECLGHGAQADDRAARGQHAIIMRRFRRVLEDNPEQPLYIPEICKAIGVSERSLRVCSQEYLGMSPKRYLLLRRMHLARRALRAATAGEANVTVVAMRYGFWQLGRFAVEYRALFGETPSATLRRQPDRPSARVPISHSAAL
jgi:AraC-like DNA-binding protein